jgi:hypothetical protein
MRGDLNRPDDVLGAVVVAYVALRPEADIGELHDLGAERLAKDKRPRTIEGYTRRLAARAPRIPAWSRRR